MSFIVIFLVCMHPYYILKVSLKLTHTYAIMLVKKFQLIILASIVNLIRIIVEAKPAEINNLQQDSQPFVGAFVFPHGGVTLDPETRDFSQEPGNGPQSQFLSLKLHNAMRLAAKSLVETKPDIIILSTPHGFYLEDHYLLISAPLMSGTAGWSWANFTASFDIAKTESARMYLALKKDENPVEFLALGVGGSPMPLHWGEVIPWWFIQQAASEAGFTLPPVIYIGQPASKLLDKLLKLGKDIVKFSKSELSSRRVAVVVSGDLSHMHSKQSFPQSPYPFDKSSTVFDGFIKEWAQTDRNPQTERLSSDLLLERAFEVAEPAGTCGYSGLVMLHGILQQLVQEGQNFKAQFYEYAAPTYFGMVVTSWLPQ